MPQELYYQVALTQISQIGDVIAKRLIDHFGSASAVFAAKRSLLELAPEIGTMRAAAIRQFDGFARVEEELRFIERYQIQPVFYGTSAYPKRLYHCHDGPVLLYFKGSADLNAAKMVSVIGTRSPSAYGKKLCEQLVHELADTGVTIVSGLAYGVDVIAHKAALEAGLPTIGVLAHGLDRLYPAAHKAVAQQMTTQGGLLTDYMSGTSPDKQHFPMRNRIVAGLSDATIVIESGIKGGSLITADIAYSYNRDVLALPGRVGDIQAAGCLHLIKSQKATLITSASDVVQLMGWDVAVSAAKVPVQPDLFVVLSNEEEQVLSLFIEKTELHIDEIYIRSGLPGSQVATAVLNLQMNHQLKCLPGQVFQRT